MKPRVTIGIPVYNGEKYLAQAIESVLAQTFADFELIICDNASTDATAAMTLAYAARDDRVRYTRNRENIGAGRNFNRVVELGTGQYFKWMAADDVIAPEFLENCVAALDAEPSAVLAYTRGTGIDANGAVLKHCQHPVPLEAQTDPVKRFRLFRERSGFSAWPFLYVFGLMRREVLVKTRLHGVFSGGDISFLYEMVLAGPFVEVPLHMSQFRWHQDSYTWRESSLRVKSGAAAGEEKTWLKFFHGRKTNWTAMLIGNRRLHLEYVVSIMRARITRRQKLGVLWANLEWMFGTRSRSTIPEQSLLAPMAITR